MLIILGSMSSNKEGPPAKINPELAIQFLFIVYPPRKDLRWPRLEEQVTGATLRHHLNHLADSISPYFMSIKITFINNDNR
jgi:hypothetical protein